MRMRKSRTEAQGPIALAIISLLHRAAIQLRKTPFVDLSLDLSSESLPPKSLST